MFKQCFVGAAMVAGLLGSAGSVGSSHGLAISLIFGIFVSTPLTLVVIPVLYYAAYRSRLTPASQGESA